MPARRDSSALPAVGDACSALLLDRETGGVGRRPRRLASLTRSRHAHGPFRALVHRGFGGPPV